MTLENFAVRCFQENPAIKPLNYIYFNRDFLKFTGKRSTDISENEIRDYLVYLAENKQSATSTLDQAINAPKFYYGLC